MKIARFLVLLLFVVYITACKQKATVGMDEKVKQQLSVIDSLLRSLDFSQEIARVQDTAYYKGIGQPVPPFLSAEEDTATIAKPAREEKIATNLAGFYALECGLGLLCSRDHEKPAAWLQKIVDEKADSASILLLNRFANATWKAGQPFRDLKRITRSNFTVASFLPDDEIKKDYYQVKTAATKLLASLAPVKDSSLETQMQQLRSLLHNQQYAVEMAAYMDSGYYASQQQPIPPFISNTEETALIHKPVKDQKIATNVAGFYALECGLNYLVTTKKTAPGVILQSIIENTISPADKDLFSRFANATWKAGQPFRGLNRIERETFAPFYFLTKEDIEKDWVQIKAAAGAVLSKL